MPSEEVLEFETDNEFYRVRKSSRRKAKQRCHQIVPAARRNIISTHIRVTAKRPKQINPTMKQTIDETMTTSRTVSKIFLERSCSILIADAPIYIPVAKTRIPAAPVTCERICGST
jgi:hypothetical protein